MQTLQYTNSNQCVTVHELEVSLYDGEIYINGNKVSLDEAKQTQIALANAIDEYHKLYISGRPEWR